MRSQRRIVIIGNGVAGITAALTVRERDERAAITVVSDESDWFFSRTALMYALMGRLDRRDMEPYERAVYDRRRITRVRGRAVDLKVRDPEGTAAAILRLDDGRALECDALLLATGSRPRRLSGPGLDDLDRIRGVVGFVSLPDLDAVEALVPSTRRAVVVGGGLIGIELVESLCHLGRAVTFLVREPSYWPMALAPEEGALVTTTLREHGVDVRHDEELAGVDLDKEGRVAAARTRSGDRIPCELLGVCIGVEPAIDWLRAATTPPALGRGVIVDEELRTSLPGVWAAGDCAEIRFADPARLPPSVPSPLVEQLWYSARRQGLLAGRNLTGACAPYLPPLYYNSAKLLDLEFTTVGDLRHLPAGARSLLREHPTRPITQRLVHTGDRVVGFNMLGSRWDHAVLAAWIDERRPLDWVLAHLHRAQMDVELGRIDLRNMRERELPAPGVTPGPRPAPTTTTTTDERPTP